MSVTERRHHSDIPLRIRNDAAAWIMQLHASDRTSNIDAALRKWLDESPVHREAFEIASDMWNASATLPVSIVARITGGERHASRMRSRPLLAVAACVLALVLGGFVYLSGSQSLVTAVGEQRTLTLEDDTRVTLNTATRLTVSYDDRVRRIVLKRGEALFEVSKNQHRPFVVSVAGREVTALGTAFIVRHEADQTAVTLVDGKISVAGDARRKATVLQPGERLTLDRYARSKLDRPPLERLTAWKRGQAAFQNTLLSDAVEEMNRYNGKKLVIGDAAAGSLRVSGIFRVGESETFALALANTYPLRIQEEEGAVVIRGIDRAN